MILSKNDGFTMENPIEIDDFIQEWWFYHGQSQSKISMMIWGVQPYDSG